MSWEAKISEACDKTGAICKHSRQAPAGNHYNFDMTCIFVPSNSRRLYSIAVGEYKARLHCIGCANFAPDNS